VVIEARKLMDPDRIDEPVLLDLAKVVVSECRVTGSDRPPCRDESPPLFLTERPDREGLLDLGEPDSLAVELDYRLGCREVGVIITSLEMRFEAAALRPEILNRSARAKRGELLRE